MAPHAGTTKRVAQTADTATSPRKEPRGSGDAEDAEDANSRSSPGARSGGRVGVALYPTADDACAALRAQLDEARRAQAASQRALDAERAARADERTARSDSLAAARRDVATLKGDLAAAEANASAREEAATIRENAADVLIDEHVNLTTDLARANRTIAQLREANADLLDEIKRLKDQAQPSISMRPSLFSPDDRILPLPAGSGMGNLGGTPYYSGTGGFPGVISPTKGPRPPPGPPPED